MLISIVWYGLSVFAAPDISRQIDNLLWISGFSDTLRWGKESFDDVVTDIPSLGEVRSGALDAKQKFLDGVDTTKETIDSVRGWAQKAEETLTEAKETYDQAKETYDQAKETFNDLTGKVEEVQGVMEDVQNITNTQE